MESSQSVHQTFKIKKVPSTHHIIPEKKILIIYSSGYFGMEKPEAGGFKHKKGFLLSYMRNHPNFCDRDALYSYQEKNPSLHDFLVTPHSIHNRRILYKILETDEISDSSDMNMELWKKIGGLIKNNYEGYDAFVIIHGTDTMNYTASVLSFMLENLNKPVILTGSQIPLVEMRNDAQRNLIDTLTIAGSYHIPEVCIMFDSVLFRGNRTIKNDNMRLSAFECPNISPLGEIGIKVKINWDVVLPPPKEEFSFFDNLNNQICIVKFFPIIKDETFQSFFNPSIKAVILETYGSGNMPRDRPEIFEIMKEANDRGVIIVNVSQCRKGIVSTNYECGKILEQYGVVFAGDMTVECALAKLSYLLGKNYENAKIKKLMQENLRGEITPAKTDDYSVGSKKFINALINLMDKKEAKQDEQIFALNLIPKVINELAEKNNIPMMKKLKNYIININFSECTKRNPLHIAAIKGHFDMVKFLLKLRIGINDVDESKSTPLNYACLSGHAEIAKLLKDQGGILNMTRFVSDKLLEYAYKGDLEKLRLFYDCGANLNVENYDKRTVAHIAAAEGHFNIIKFLVEETNVNIMVSDRWGNTPFSEAKDNEIKELIRKKYKNFNFLQKKRKRVEYKFTLIEE